MIEIPKALSPIGQRDERTALAYGPFIVEHSSLEGSRTYPGFLLDSDDEGRVTWLGYGHQHAVRPVQEPAAVGDAIRFSGADEDGDYLIRPLSPEDAQLAGAPADVTLDADALTALAETVWSREFGVPEATEISEENLYLTRDESGAPLALMKMGAGHPTLIRQDNGWRQLADDEDELLGHSDVPVKEDAVTAWDSGELQRLEQLLMDERFSPKDVLNLWAEVGDSTEIKRLLAERSRGRVYERSQGRWVDAQPNPDAATVDLLWSAVGAWDDDDLRNLSQADEFDANGDAA